MAIGIFGGAFNPPHKEHINMIKKALEYGLEQIVIVPSKNPPHKNTCVTSFRQRVDMLNIALLGVSNYVIDEIENEDDSVHYTYEVLPKLIDKYKDVVFLIGGDSLIDFHTWRNPELIIKMCPLLVFARGEKSQEFLAAKKYWEDLGANITVLDYEPEDVSSTLVRHLLALGYRDLIDEKVEHYIDDNGLYNDYASYIQKLSSILNSERFYHSIRTAKCALYLNDKHKLGLNPDSVLLAGLLHDCAKKLEKDPSVDKEGVPKDSIGTPVEHQFLGAILAEKLFDVHNREILDGIRYHTTGKADMTTMEKLIYCADLLEEGREYDFIPPLRKIMDEDFEKGFVACITQQYNYLRESKEEKDIYPLTVECAKYYMENK